MRLQDIMNRQVRTIASRATADDAWDVMQQNNCRHLVVTDRGRVVGIVSARDLGGRRVESRRGRSVADVMTPQVISARPTATVRQAANLLRGYVIGCLPVIDEGRLRGIVTTSDLLDLVGRGSERPRRRVARPTLRHKQVRTPLGRRG